MRWRIRATRLLRGTGQTDLDQIVAIKLCRRSERQRLDQDFGVVPREFRLGEDVALHRRVLLPLAGPEGAVTARHGGWIKRRVAVVEWVSAVTQPPSIGEERHDEDVDVLERSVYGLDLVVRRRDGHQISVSLFDRSGQRGSKVLERRKRT